MSDDWKVDKSPGEPLTGFQLEYSKEQFDSLQLTNMRMTEDDKKMGYQLMGITKSYPPNGKVYKVYYNPPTRTGSVYSVHAVNIKNSAPTKSSLGYENTEIEGQEKEANDFEKKFSNYKLEVEQRQNNVKSLNEDELHELALQIRRMQENDPNNSYLKLGILKINNSITDLHNYLTGKKLSPFGGRKYKKSSKRASRKSRKHRKGTHRRR